MPGGNVAEWQEKGSPTNYPSEAMSEEEKRTFDKNNMSCRCAKCGNQGHWKKQCKEQFKMDLFQSPEGQLTDDEITAETVTEEMKEQNCPCAFLQSMFLYFPEECGKN